MNTRDTIIVRLARWLEDYWPQIITAIGTIGMGAGGILVSINWSPSIAISVFVGSAVLSISGQLGTWQRSPGIKSLQQHVSELEDIIEQSKNDYFQLFENHLGILANDKLRLSDTERISVYKYEEEAFVMLGRYSKNPEYCKRGRGKYPADQGCIAEAWRKGEVFVTNLPDPNDEEERYLNMMKDRWKIKKIIARNFKMKSRCYYGFAIENVEQQRIAIVIIESVNPKGFVKDEINRNLVNGEAREIGNFLERMRRLEPSPSFAKEEGY